jgi:hypothetical protein
MGNARWPELSFQQWQETRQTLHRWVQIIGKVRLAKSPWVNHGWHSTLYVTERGLTTSAIHDGDEAFSLELDFISHELRIQRSDGARARVPLASEPVAAFYRRCLDALARAGVQVRISGRPNELADALPFAEDRIHGVYVPEDAHRFWRALLQADRVLKGFRARYPGKTSPVHFFWGAMDLAVTRFSGRRAPEHPGGIPHLPDLVTREAYSHEVSSCGFWPGDERLPEAAFYAYAYPKPEGYERAAVPGGAYFHAGLREFILPYATVRSSPDPDRLLLEFFQGTYDAAARLGGWDSEALKPSPYLEQLRKRAA